LRDVWCGVFELRLLPDDPEDEAAVLSTGLPLPWPAVRPSLSLLSD
jgi:hypothetical protein